MVLQCVHGSRAHEAWGLETPPDFVTFSKKMQVAGFYCRRDVLPREAYRVFNTWMGDPVRVLQLEVGRRLNLLSPLLPSIHLAPAVAKGGGRHRD